MKSGKRFDLVVLTADDNAMSAVEAVLSRPEAMGIRKLTWTSYVHPDRDPGCRLSSHSLLLREVVRCEHAVVVFDREGCGMDAASAGDLAMDVEARLAASGWGSRSSVIVCDPEVDRWVWSASPHVDAHLGWHGRTPSLRDWLVQQQFIAMPTEKPARPKEALEAALRVVRKPRSSSIYRQIGQTVSLTSCTDEAFVKLRTTLQRWFPIV